MHARATNAAQGAHVPPDSQRCKPSQTSLAKQYTVPMVCQWRKSATLARRAFPQVDTHETRQPRKAPDKYYLLGTLYKMKDERQEDETAGWVAMTPVGKVRDAMGLPNCGARIEVSE